MCIPLIIIHSIIVTYGSHLVPNLKIIKSIEIAFRPVTACSFPAYVCSNLAAKEVEKDK